MGWPWPGIMLFLDGQSQIELDGENHWLRTNAFFSGLQSRAGSEEVQLGSAFTRKGFCSCGNDLICN